MDKMYDVIVVGAGNGGLAAAANTAYAGLKTLLLEKHNIELIWVKGHAGHPENERCDRLAVAAGAGAVAAGVQLPPDSGYQPEEAILL